MPPYLSFVMAARNDDYGGDLLHRIQTCVDSILQLGERHGLDGEIVLVEWNPPEGEMSLEDALEWPTGLDYMSVRIVTVPPNIHNLLPNSDKFPLFEYIAKNTGIRRAKGEYILSCNPDLVYSNEMIAFFAKRNLEPDNFYRARRYDVDSLVPLGAPIYEQLAYAENHTYKYSTVNDGYLTINKSTRFRKELNRMLKVISEDPTRAKYFVTDPKRICDFVSDIFCNIFSTGSRNKSASDTETDVSPFPITITSPKGIDDLFMTSSGDFLLLHTEAWQEINGYPELDTNLHIDSLGCVYAMKQGLDQAVLEPPSKIYHQEHDRSERDSRPAMDRDDLVEKAQEILSKSEFEPYNDSSWGLAGKELEIQRVVSPN